MISPAAARVLRSARTCSATIVISLSFSAGIISGLIVSQIDREADKYVCKFNHWLSEPKYIGDFGWEHIKNTTYKE